MLERNEYINQVWEKYNNCLHNNKIKKEYNNKIFKNVKRKLIIKNIIATIITIFSTFGVVYAGITVYNNSFISKKIDIDLIEHSEFNDNFSNTYSQDFTLLDGISYKKVMSYEEYLRYSKIMNNALIEMSEEDFEKYFLIITHTRSF